MQHQICQERSEAYKHISTTEGDVGSRTTKNTITMNQRQPIWLNSIASAASPEMDDHSIVVHCSRDTVHGGNHRARLAAFTIAGTV